MTINQVQPIYVTFAVPEARLSEIKQRMAGGRIEVFVTGQDGDPAPERGVVTFVDNSVDITTGTIKVKATVSNAGRRLWPGQFVRITVRLSTRANAALVPNQAVQTGQEGAYVYVVKQDNTVESRPVVTSARVDQDLVVDRGSNPANRGPGRPASFGAGHEGRGTRSVERARWGQAALQELSGISGELLGYFYPAPRGDQLVDAGHRHVRLDRLPRFAGERPAQRGFPDH